MWKVEVPQKSTDLDVEQIWFMQCRNGSTVSLVTVVHIAKQSDVISINVAGSLKFPFSKISSRQGWKEWAVDHEERSTFPLYIALSSLCLSMFSTSNLFAASPCRGTSSYKHKSIPMNREYQIFCNAFSLSFFGRFSRESLCWRPWFVERDYIGK